MFRLGGGAGLRGASLLLIGLLAGCDRPSWTDPETSKGPREPPASSMPKDESVHTVVKPPPPQPAWAAGLIGKELKSALPRLAPCIGNTDVVLRKHVGPTPGALVAGWAWDPKRKAPLDRFVLVDSGGRIVGAGRGGFGRRDVPAAVPTVTSAVSGWLAVATINTGRVQAFGVLDGDATCPLGGVDL